MAKIARPIRVLHIISGDLWAGAEAQAFTLLTHLKNKVDLHVVLMNDLELASRLRESGVAVTIIPEQSTSSFQIIFKLIKAIVKLKPDIIHTHRQKENILGSLANLLALPFRFKITHSVRTTHGAPEFSPKGKQRIQATLDTWVAKYFQKGVIAVSNGLSSQLSPIYGPQKVFIIENGIDVDALRNHRQIADFRKTQPDAIHVGIIGRVEPVKRIDIFVEMATYILKQKTTGKPFRFHIIGDGKLSDEMKETVKKSGHDANIIFHGHRSDIPDCISSLDFIVMCSDHEGTPMTSLESLALNTPLIAHCVGGLKEVLADYPQLLVEEHISTAYGDRLLSLSTAPKLHVELNPKYHATRNAELTLQLYTDVLK